MYLVRFWVLWAVLGGLENRAFKALLWSTYALALVIYKTQLLGRFGAFWRHCGAGGLGGLASRENFDYKNARCGCAHDVRGGAGACACMCAGARACVCAYTYDPPLKKMTPLKKRGPLYFFWARLKKI